MQLLVQALDVSYLANIHKMVFGMPSLISSSRQTKLAGEIPLVSRNGTTNGPQGPWEGADWWYRFFPRDPQYVSDSMLVEVDTDGLSHSLSVWTGRVKRSLLFKNTLASLRIRALYASAPFSVFIHIERNVVDNAHSLLEARIRQQGDLTSWLALEPPGWEAARQLDPVSQVLFQIETTNCTIRRDLEAMQVPGNQVLSISYEDLCRDTPKTVRRIVDFAERHGVRKRRSFRSPPSLSMRTEVTIPINLHVELLRRRPEVANFKVYE